MIPYTKYDFQEEVKRALPSRWRSISETDLATDLWPIVQRLIDTHYRYVQLTGTKINELENTIRKSTTIRSCNRHADCDKADREAGSPRVHCHDDCCTDCFGD